MVNILPLPNLTDLLAQYLMQENNEKIEKLETFDFLFMLFSW